MILPQTHPVADALDGVEIVVDGTVVGHGSADLLDQLTEWCYGNETGALRGEVSCTLHVAQGADTTWRPRRIELDGVGFHPPDVPILALV